MNKMQDLVEKLNKACYAYYALDAPIMDDKSFDALYDELVALEQKTGVVLAGSPTQKVQGYVIDGFQKVGHSKPMLSANKTKDIRDIKKYLDGHGEWYCSGKLDGCFPKDARVKMADGTEKKIVDVKVGDYVASYNETTNEVEPKKVINVFENGRKLSSEWVRIKLYSKNPLNNNYYLKCTKNHKILTTEGWVEADKLNIDDKVYRYGYVLSDSQSDFLIGIGLGDGCIIKRQNDYNSINSVQCQYSKVDKYPYNLMIDKSLELFDFNNPKLRTRKSGYGSNMIDVNFHIVNHKVLSKNLNINRCGITFTKEVLDNLTPLSLAILYIDDGSRCTCLDDGYECSVNRQVRCRIAVNRHPDMYVKAFSEWMSNHGYYNRINFEKPVISNDNSSGCFLELNVDGTSNFYDAIAPYIPKELRYIKLGTKERWQNCEEIRWWENKGKIGVIEGEIVEITDGLKDRHYPYKGLRTCKPIGYQSFDLEIEDNHTYFVNNYVVHNCTLVTKFSGGKFVQGITRGTGLVGEDVTDACRFITNLPMQIPYEGDLELRGECVMDWNEFNRINEGLVEKYSHPRNLAAGTLRQLDLNVVKERKLSFVVFECITELEGVDSKADILHWLAYNQGFETVIRRVSSEFDHPIYEQIRGRNETLEETVDIMTKSVKANKYPYDGLIFELDSVAESKRQGVTQHHPEYRIALKWADDEYESCLRDIEWQVGKSGQITPIGVFDTVLIDNVEINKASLANISVMKKTLGKPYYGQKILVGRMNMVIPKIVGAVFAEDDSVEYLTIPERCPVCSAPVKIIKQNDSEVLYCSNKWCKGKTIGLLKHFVSKAGMDITGLSEKTLLTLYNRGLVTTFIDIYELKNHRSDLERIPGFGKKSIDKLLSSIEDSAKDVDLAHFISALSIPNIGLAQAKTLANSCGQDWDTFYKRATEGYDFTKLSGFGDVIKRSILDWANDSGDVDILVTYLSFRNPNNNQYSSGFSGSDVSNLNGLTFVVTGSVHHFANRAELTKCINAHGGRVASSVSKNTSYLINNDATSSSSKNLKAKSLGVPIITEDEFLAMLNKLEE